MLLTPAVDRLLDGHDIRVQRGGGQEVDDGLKGLIGELPDFQRRCDTPCKA
ncbi:hypothetical protein L497_1057 [Bordetella holmesii CDC-H585-BH]|uniref:Uncharacterized protein n=1 Tax=Bordetella holmesii CDC-H585-BH TaxID=1331206 RepID=A0A158M646_9BORD|nr:hypothetical protein L497_1057 [Bordetella holmesii CDC-H585-BH]